MRRYCWLSACCTFQSQKRHENDFEYLLENPWEKLIVVAIWPNFGYRSASQNVQNAEPSMLDYKHDYKYDYKNGICNILIIQERGFVKY